MLPLFNNQTVRASNERAPWLEAALHAAHGYMHAASCSCCLHAQSQHCLHMLLAINTAVCPTAAAMPCTACRALQHTPPSLLELKHTWEVYGAAWHPLDLSHLAALTKLTSGKGCCAY
jgi:predicted exporter